jgi:hypothetical protein
VRYHGNAAPEFLSEYVIRQFAVKFLEEFVLPTFPRPVLRITLCLFQQGTANLFCVKSNGF